MASITQEKIYTIGSMFNSKEVEMSVWFEALNIYLNFDNGQTASENFIRQFNRLNGIQNSTL